MTTVETMAMFAPSALVTFDWEPQSGGILITKIIGDEPIGSVLLMGDDHLFLLDALNRATRDYDVQAILGDFYGANR